MFTPVSSGRVPLARPGKGLRTLCHLASRISFAKLMPSHFREPSPSSRAAKEPPIALAAGRKYCRLRARDRPPLCRRHSRPCGRGVACALHGRGPVGHFFLGRAGRFFNTENDLQLGRTRLSLLQIPQTFRRSRVAASTPRSTAISGEGYLHSLNRRRVVGPWYTAGMAFATVASLEGRKC
jgi:hypothetical protein